MQSLTTFPPSSFPYHNERFQWLASEIHRYQKPGIHRSLQEQWDLIGPFQDNPFDKAYWANQEKGGQKSLFPGGFVLDLAEFYLLDQVLDKKVEIRAEEEDFDAVFAFEW